MALYGAGTMTCRAARRVVLVGPWATALPELVRQTPGRLSNVSIDSEALSTRTGITFNRASSCTRAFCTVVYMHTTPYETTDATPSYCSNGLVVTCTGLAPGADSDSDPPP